MYQRGKKATPRAVDGTANGQKKKGRPKRQTTTGSPWPTDTSPSGQVRKGGTAMYSESHHTGTNQYTFFHGQHTITPHSYVRVCYLFSCYFRFLFFFSRETPQHTCCTRTRNGRTYPCIEPGTREGRALASSTTRLRAEKTHMHIVKSSQSPGEAESSQRWTAHGFNTIARRESRRQEPRDTRRR